VGSEERAAAGLAAGERLTQDLTMHLEAWGLGVLGGLVRIAVTARLEGARWEAVVGWKGTLTRSTLREFSYVSITNC